MYHDVVAAGAEDTSGFPGRDAALYKVTPEAFVAHLRALTRARQRRSSADAANGHPRALTFDDGGVSAMYAADLLDSHGVHGHFFVTANYIGTPGFVTADHIRELARRGHRVGSHSCSHPLRMGHCSWPRLLDEWQRSRDILSEILGDDVRAASVPGGDFAPRVAEAAARAGITWLFTSEPTTGTREMSGVTVFGRFTIKRWTTAETAAALAAGGWLPCACQAVVWKAKKITKRLGGPRYLQIRKLLLRPGKDVQWGDWRS